MDRILLYVKTYLHIFTLSLSTESTSTLFRGSTLATTLMDQYMKMTTTSFLHTAVQSIINRIMESKQSCEVGDTDPFRTDVPGFQVPSDSVFPSQHRFSSRALPLRLYFDNCSGVFCSSLLLTCPNHCNLLLLMTVAIGSTIASYKISSFVRCSSTLTPIAHRTMLIYVVAIHLFVQSIINRINIPFVPSLNM